MYIISQIYIDTSSCPRPSISAVIHCYFKLQNDRNKKKETDLLSLSIREADVCWGSKVRQLDGCRITSHLNISRSVSHCPQSYAGVVPSNTLKSLPFKISYNIIEIIT